MKLPEDQAWDQIVERIELGVTDAQLAEAERALSGVEAEVVPRDFVETVMARAISEVVEEVEAPEPVKLRILPRLRRFAAAAAMLLFGTKLSAATTVTVLAAVTTTVVVVIQNSGGMTYSELLELLRDDNNSRNEKSSGLFQVSNRIKSAVGQLKQIRDDGRTPPSVAEATRQGLERLAKREVSPTLPTVIDLKDAMLGASDASLGEVARVTYVESVLSLAAVGLELIESFDARGADLVAQRDLCLRRLRSLLEH